MGSMPRISIYIHWTQRCCNSMVGVDVEYYAIFVFSFFCVCFHTLQGHSETQYKIYIFHLTEADSRLTLPKKESVICLLPVGVINKTAL